MQSRLGQRARENDAADVRHAGDVRLRLPILPSPQLRGKIIGGQQRGSLTLGTLLVPAPVLGAAVWGKQLTEGVKLAVARPRVATKGVTQAPSRRQRQVVLPSQRLSRLDDDLAGERLKILIRRGAVGATEASRVPAKRTQRIDRPQLLADSELTYAHAQQETAGAQHTARPLSSWQKRSAHQHLAVILDRQVRPLRHHRE